MATAAAAGTLPRGRRAAGGDGPPARAPPPAAGPCKARGDLDVPRLGFGAMRITGKGIWGPPPDHDTALAVLRRLPELGVDFIDTADSYGPHVSEDLIAQALAPYDGMVVATKARLTPPGPGGS